MNFPSESSAVDTSSGIGRLFAKGHGQHESFPRAPRGVLRSSTWSFSIDSSARGAHDDPLVFVCAVNGTDVGQVTLCRLGSGGGRVVTAFRQTFEAPPGLVLGAGPVTLSLRLGADVGKSLGNVMFVLKPPGQVTLVIDGAAPSVPARAGASGSRSRCVFWGSGSCLKGDACPFSHEGPSGSGAGRNGGARGGAAAVATTPPPAAAPANWACAICTFVNRSARSLCAVCGGQRPTEADDAGPPPAPTALARQLSSRACALLSHGMGSPTQEVSSQDAELHPTQAPEMVALKREMTTGSREVFDTFLALNSDGFATAADVLKAAAAAEAAGVLKKSLKLEVQRILLERGVSAAQTRLNAMVGQGGRSGSSSDDFSNDGFGDRGGRGGFGGHMEPRPAAPVVPGVWEWRLEDGTGGGWVTVDATWASLLEKNYAAARAAGKRSSPVPVILGGAQWMAEVVGTPRQAGMEGFFLTQVKSGARGGASTAGLRRREVSQREAAARAAVSRAERRTERPAPPPASSYLAKDVDDDDAPPPPPTSSSALRRQLTTRAAATFDAFAARAPECDDRDKDLAGASALLAQLSVLAAQGSLDGSTRAQAAKTLVDHGVSAAQKQIDGLVKAQAAQAAQLAAAAAEAASAAVAGRGGEAEGAAHRGSHWGGGSDVTRHRDAQDAEYTAALASDKAKRAAQAAAAAADAAAADAAAAAADAAKEQAMASAQAEAAASAARADAAASRLARARAALALHLPVEPLAPADVLSGAAVSCLFAGLPPAPGRRVTRLVPATATVELLHALVDVAIADFAAAGGGGGTAVDLPAFELVAGFPQRPLHDPSATLADLGLSGRETIRIVLLE